MSKIVFVLGAGASVHSGTPLMGNFLQIAQDLLRNGEVEDVKDDYKDVFDAVGYLREVHSKAKLKLNNIEVIFTAFEMGRLLGVLPRIKNKQAIENLLISLKNVIGYTLQQTMRLNKKNDTDSPQAYWDFTGIIENLVQQKIDSSIISFNYDLGLDYALNDRGILTDYGLEDIDIENKRHISLYKLHGSLNWGICNNSLCKKISPNRQFQYKMSFPGANYSIIPSVSDLRNGRQCIHCSKQLEKAPFIVPPTWNKTSFHGQIEQVWEKAAQSLKDAETIIVIGYSFPPTDWFFNYLFALGVDMTTQIRGFYIYDTDLKVEERFKDFLGPDVIDQINAYHITFEQAVKSSLDPQLGIGVKTIPQILNIKPHSSNGLISFVPKGSGIYKKEF